MILSNQPDFVLTNIKRILYLYIYIVVVVVTAQSLYGGRNPNSRMCRALN